MKSNNTRWLAGSRGYGRPGESVFGLPAQGRTCCNGEPPKYSISRTASFAFGGRRREMFHQDESSSLLDAVVTRGARVLREARICWRVPGARGGSTRQGRGTTREMEASVVILRALLGSDGKRRRCFFFNNEFAASPKSLRALCPFGLPNRYFHPRASCPAWHPPAALPRSWRSSRPSR